MQVWGRHLRGRDSSLSRKISLREITVMHKQNRIRRKGVVFACSSGEMVESWEGGGSRSTVHANFAFDSMNKGAPLPATYCRLHTELPDQKQLSSRLSSAATRLVRAQGFSSHRLDDRPSSTRGKKLYTRLPGKGRRVALIFEGYRSHRRGENRLEILRDGFGRFIISGEKIGRVIAKWRVQRPCRDSRR